MSREKATKIRFYQQQKTTLIVDSVPSLSMALTRFIHQFFFVSS